MQSRYSLRLGRPFGIQVSVHWTFSLLIAWIIAISIIRGLDLIQVVMHILFIFAIFACVVLHELGHSLVAIRFGGSVESITLLPIGGMAQLSKMPEKPKEEFLVSIAGPAVNVVIAALLWMYIALFHPVSLDALNVETITRENFPVMLLAANLFIVAFNLIPAFPMDGDVFFRSALSIRMSRIDATRIAKDIGQVFAILFIVAGLFYNPFLVIIGFFILLGAKGEYEMIKYQEVLRDHVVGEIVHAGYSSIDEEDTLKEAADKLVHISDNGFVVTSKGEFSGILTKDDLINGLNIHGKEVAVKEVMRADVEKVSPEAPLYEIYQQMQKTRQPLLPVFDEEAFKGILDLENLHEFFLIKSAMNRP